MVSKKNIFDKLSLKKKMELNKQQVITKINSSKTVTGLKLDADENTQLLNRKLDDKIRTIKMKLQKNQDVTVVFIHN